MMSASHSPANRLHPSQSGEWWKVRVLLLVEQTCFPQEMKIREISVKCPVLSGSEAHVLVMRAMGACLSY